MDTKISKADGLGISIVTERESGIRLGTVRKAEERTPVNTRDGGFYYTMGHIVGTVWYAYSHRPGASTDRIGAYSTRAAAVDAVVRAWTR